MLLLYDTAEHNNIIRLIGKCLLIFLVGQQGEQNKNKNRKIHSKPFFWPLAIPLGQYFADNRSKHQKKKKVNTNYTVSKIMKKNPLMILIILFFFFFFVGLGFELRASCLQSRCSTA
jgi:hypothetical protein